MIVCNKLAVYTSALAMFAAPMLGAVEKAEARTKTHHRYYTYRQQPQHFYGGRRSPEGDPIDSNGWRLKNGSWDSSCFRNLDYLSSMFACSGGGGKF
jgi:hypothetical protein